MFKNYDVRILGIVSGFSLVVGFTTGYFTRRYLSYTDSNDNQVAKLFLHPCPHMSPPHDPPSTTYQSNSNQSTCEFNSQVDKKNNDISVQTQ